MILSLVVQGLFALVFVRACIAYARSRDPLQRDVMLVFSAVGALFFLTVIIDLVTELPKILSVLAVTLFLGQPYLTLRLVGQLRPVARWVRWTALAGWIGTAVPMAFAGDAPPTPLLLATVVVFAFGESAAAIYFAAEARRRAGASLVRLSCAAAATALFAASILTAGATQGPIPSIVALVSGVGYVLAFMPPRWLRRIWSIRAAYNLVRSLLEYPRNQSRQVVWNRYADAIRQVSGSDAATVLVPSPEDRPAEVGWSGPGEMSGAIHSASHAAEMLAMIGTVDVAARRRASPPTIAVELARRAGARFVTAVPLSLPGGKTGALVLLNRHRSLFSSDDAVLLGEIGAQAAILADHEALTAQLATAAEAAAAASKAKSDFVASMSHELRTPLNAIIGFSELMGYEDGDGDTRRVPAEWIDHIHTSGRHLLGLINDVLDLSKVEAGRIELRREAVDLGSAVSEAVTALAPLLDNKGLKVTVAVPPLTVPADRVRLRQVLDNLLSNAIKFSPQDGRIFVVARRAGAHVHLSVIDTGPGIALQDQKRVFEEFHQVGDPSMHKAGTGLGLALARRLIEAHGGHIELESEPGHGARFTIVLPAPGLADAVPDAQSPAEAFRGGILVIEDDPAASGLISTHLARAGYEVTTVRTGEEGLAAARTCAPDVILLDIILPGIDGWEVLRHLKDDERLRHVPVAVITVVDDRQVGLALGAVDYFVKPISGEMLLSWLARRGLIPPLADTVTNVLVVDDDPGVLTLVERTLGGEGLRVVTASDGLEGLNFARNHRFDLIICDLLMPNLDGFTLIAALHDDPATRDVPVVVLTAHDLTEADKQRLRGKILGVLTKDDAISANLRDWLSRIEAATAPAASGSASVTTTIV